MNSNHDYLIKNYMLICQTNGPFDINDSVRINEDTKILQYDGNTNETDAINFLNGIDIKKLSHQFHHHIVKCWYLHQYIVYIKKIIRSNLY